MEWIYAIIALLNVIAAIFAWLTRLQWKRDTIATRDETISSKNMQIESLRRETEMLQDLIPTKIHEYFLGIREQLEEYISKLQNELKETKAEIAANDKTISKLKAKETDRSSRIKELEVVQDRFLTRLNALESELLNAERYVEVTEFLVNDPFYETLRKPSVDEAVDWFFEDYEAAANSVPYDASKGGYQYVYGGPYDVREELFRHFPDSSVRDVLHAVEAIEEKGTEWVKRGQY